MRADDVQCVRPESMRLTIEGFACKLWKTKTTGPDRRVNMVQVFISRKAGFSGQDWLAQGYKLWSEIEYKRDFLVLQTSDDWETCVNRGVDASTVAETVLLGREKGYVEADALDSLQAFAEGRGEIGAVVAETVLLGREKGYVEADALDSLQAFAEGRGEIGAVVRARHELVRSPKSGGNPRLGGRFPPLFLQSLQGPHLVTEDHDEDGGADAFPKGEAQFQAIADDRAGSRAAAATDFGIPADTPAGRQQTAAIISSKEIELRAEARALNQPRILQTQERQAMIRAVSTAYGKLNEAETPSAEYLALKAEETEQNEPTAAQLDTITSKRDSQTATIQSSVDPAGHLRIIKTKQKVEMPQNSEAYRRVMKIEGYAWLAMQSRYKSKTWLQGLTMADFTKFVDYILGERVAGLRLEQNTGYDSSQNALFRPPWGIVLRYEYKLRKEAFRLINEEGQTLQAALLSVTRDTELKGRRQQS
eukprot:s10768_g1.t1